MHVTTYPPLADNHAHADDLDDELLTVREVAAKLRVDDTTVRRWIKAGALIAVTLPHRGRRQGYRIKASTMRALFTPSVPRSEGYHAQATQR